MNYLCAQLLIMGLQWCSSTHAVNIDGDVHVRAYAYNSWGSAKVVRYDGRVTQYANWTKYSQWEQTTTGEVERQWTFNMWIHK